jgi:hypothetical protein
MGQRFNGSVASEPAIAPASSSKIRLRCRTWRAGAGWTRRSGTFTYQPPSVHEAAKTPRRTESRILEAHASHPAGFAIRYDGVQSKLDLFLIYRALSPVRTLTRIVLL